MLGKLHDIVTVVVNIVCHPGRCCLLKICEFVTKLVPKLEPVQECNSVPKESCQLKYSKPEVTKTPLITKWCLDEDDLETDETERSNPDPILDTRRTLSKSELRNVENRSTNQIIVKMNRPIENRRRPRYEEKKSKQTDGEICQTSNISNKFA